MSVPFLFSHWSFCGTSGKSPVSMSLGLFIAWAVLAAPICSAHTVAELHKGWFDSMQDQGMSSTGPALPRVVLRAVGAVEHAGGLGWVGSWSLWGRVAPSKVLTRKGLFFLLH